MKYRSLIPLVGALALAGQDVPRQQLPAENPASQKEEAPPIPDPVQSPANSAPIGPHWMTRTITIETPEGPRLQKVIKLETGMNRLSDKGDWVRAEPVIELVEGGAVASGTAHSVRFTGNLNSGGSVRLTLPDGRVMVSQGSPTPIVGGDRFTVLSTGSSTTLNVLVNDSGNTSTLPLRIVGISKGFRPRGSVAGTPSVDPQGQFLVYQPRQYSFGKHVFGYDVADSAGVDLGIVTVDVKSQPYVELTYPIKTTIFSNAPSITVAGTAVDYDGSISDVALYVNGYFYGNATTSGSNVTRNWATNTYGHYLLSLFATDNEGITNSSTPVTVVYKSPTTQVFAALDLQYSTNSVEGIPVEEYPVIRDGFFLLSGQAYAITNSGVTRDTNLVSYRVDLKPPGFGLANDGAQEYNVTPGITNFQGFVPGGDNTNSLGTLDLSRVESGVYDLVLTVRCQGVEAIHSVTISIANDLTLGNFTFSEQDLVVPVSGVPLTVVRKYDSFASATVDFGACWSMSINDMDVKLDEERVTKPVFAYNGADQNEGGEAVFSLRSGGTRNVSLVMPDGRRGNFLFKPRFSTDPTKPVAWAEWKSPHGVTAQLVFAGTQPGESELNSRSTINRSANGYNVPVWSFGESRTPYEAYDIPGYDLVLKDGTVFELRRPPSFGTGDGDWVTYDADGTGNNVPVKPYHRAPKLSAIRQPSGDRVDITASGISHTYNTTTTRSVSFIRDDRGRIDSIGDPGGPIGGWHAVRYRYNDDKNVLVQVHRLVDRTTGLYTTNQYFYDLAKYPTYLTRIVDGRGITVARNQYDERGKLIAVIDALGRTNRFIHDTVNSVELTINRLGHTNAFAYDPRGNVTAITNALGEVRRMGYDTFNNKIAETNYLGTTNIITRWDYDLARNLLTNMVDALGNASAIEYDSLYRPNWQKDVRGNISTMTYDPTAQQVNGVADSLGLITTNSYLNGLLKTTADAIGTLTTLSYSPYRQVSETVVTPGSGGAILSKSQNLYDANGNPTNTTVFRSLPNGSFAQDVTTYLYDAQSRLIGTISPDGSTNGTVYNEVGLVKETRDAYGRATQYIYNELGQRIKTIYPDTNITEQVFYDSEGRVTNTVDRLGRQTRTSFDPVGRVTTVINAFGTSDAATNQTVYDSLGRVSHTVDARNMTNLITYDVAGRRTSAIAAWGSAIAQTNQYRYDVSGSVTNVIDALGRQTWTFYDLRGRAYATSVEPLVANGPRQIVSGILYDAAGRRVAETNALGLVSSFTYDGAGRLSAVTNGIGTAGGYTAATNWARYQYDTAGNLTNQIDALSRNNYFGYDGMGRRLWSKMPSGQTTSYGYDLVGNQRAMTNADLVVITNQYDNLNRLWKRWQGGTLLESYSYYADGQRASRFDASGSYSWSYDNRGRLTQNSTPAGILTYSYDRNGNQLTLKSFYGVADMRFEYDELNRLKNVYDNRISTTVSTAVYQYDGVGNLKSLLYVPPAATNTYTYDSRNRLTNQVWTKGATTLASFNYNLNAVGSRTTLTEYLNGANRFYQWGYDSLQRLQTETLTGATVGSLNYGFDLVGNRTSRTGSLGSFTQPATTAYTPNDWITTDQYDAKGNTIVSGGNGYGYDWANRLYYGPGLYCNSDADGNRISKTVGNTTTWYLVATVNPTGYPQVVEERISISGSPTSTLSKAYCYGLDLIDQYYADYNYTSFYGYDGQGTVRFLLSATGAVDNTYVYDSYGNIISQVVTVPNNYLYTGEQWDPDLGMYYLRARYYKPSIGRFWNRDSYEGNQSDPLSLHRYLYSHGNPINGVDPSGHTFTILGFSASQAISGTLQAARVGGVVVARRVAINALYGAIIGAAAGQWDAIIDDGDPIEGLVEGAAGGAAFGAIGSIRVLQPVVALVGIQLSADSIFRAIESKKFGLASYRAIVGFGLAATSFGRIPARSIWELPPRDRGVAAQNQLARTEYSDWYEVGAEDNGFFEAADFQKGENLVSLRTVDTRLGASWKTRVRGYIKELVANKESTVGGKPANLILDLRVPPGHESEAAFLIDYGKQRGVTVIVKSVN